MGKGQKATTALAAIALALALCAANTLLGPLNQDEGWYLLAARNFARGLHPYRDFFFTQTPLMPAFYGLLEPLWAHAGLLGGRILTAALGIAASLAASAAAAINVRRGFRFAAALTAFLLLQCNIVHSYFTTIPKTYALASLFISLGTLCLSCSLLNPAASDNGRNGARHGRPAPWRAAGARAPLALAAGAFMAAAAGTRLSLGAMLPVVGLALLAIRRRHPLLWLAFGIGGLAVLAAIFFGFIADCPSQFSFANFFHGGRSSGGAILALGSLARLARNYMPAALAAGLAAFLRIRHGSHATSTPLPWIATAAFAATFVVHITAPFPYDDYQTPLMPLAAIAISAFLWDSPHAPGQSRTLPALVALAALFAATSPFTESWVVVRKDRFWVETKSRPDIMTLRDAAREISAIVPQGAAILTQDAYLAVEAGRDVPHGFEMGPFGYFAALGTDEARKFNVLNHDLALEAIKSGKFPAAALSGYSFAMSAPELAKDDSTRAEMEREVSRHYDLVKTVPDFGQEHTTLTIWALKAQ